MCVAYVCGMCMSICVWHVYVYMCVTSVCLYVCDKCVSICVWHVCVYMCVARVCLHVCGTCVYVYDVLYVRM